MEIKNKKKFEQTQERYLKEVDAFILAEPHVSCEARVAFNINDTVD